MVLFISSLAPEYQNLLACFDNAQTTNFIGARVPEDQTLVRGQLLPKFTFFQFDFRFAAHVVETAYFDPIWFTFFKN